MPVKFRLGLHLLTQRTLSVILSSIAALTGVSVKANDKESASTNMDNYTEKAISWKKKLKPNLILRLNANDNNYSLDQHRSHSSHSSHRSHSSHSSHSSHYSSSPSYTPPSNTPVSSAPATTPTPAPKPTPKPVTNAASTQPATSATKVSELKKDTSEISAPAMKRNPLKKNQAVSSTYIWETWIPVKKTSAEITGISPSYDSAILQKTKLTGLTLSKGTLGPFPRLLYKGCKGQDVNKVQMKLLLAGYDVLMTSYYGDKTEQAVIKFQLKNELEPTGKVDFQTWNAISAL